MADLGRQVGKTKKVTLKEKKVSPAWPLLEFSLKFANSAIAWPEADTPLLKL